MCKLQISRFGGRVFHVVLVAAFDFVSGASCLGLEQLGPVILEHDMCLYGWLSAKKDSTVEFCLFFH